MRSLALLVVLLSFLPSLAEGSMGTVDVLDPRVTVNGVSVAPDPNGEARTAAGDAVGLSEGKPSAVDRHAGIAARTPDAADPAFDAMARAPVVQMTFGDVHYFLAPRDDATRPMYLLLPGSDIAVPLTTRELAMAPRPFSPAAPRLVPLTLAPPPVVAMERADDPPAPAPSAPAAQPEPAAAGQGGEDAPVARWPERAALAGAAAVLLLTPFALYHRLRGDTVLGHDSRAKLLGLLRDRPGLTPADAARELGVDPSTALYHLRRLVKEGIATTDGERRGARYFAAGTIPPAQRQRVVFERESATLLEAIRSDPGTSKTTLAGRLAIARATLHWHLTRLERAGLVRCERAGREVKVFPRQETFSPGPA